jgi:hypothetical protein
MTRADGFRYLRNLGSPTRWDVACYFEYRDRVMGRLAPDLRSMVEARRYFPGAEGTLWCSKLLCVDARADELLLSFVNDARDFAFEFSYRGVQKVSSQFSSFRAMPALVVQELTVLRSGIFRHAMSDLTGSCVVVYSRHIEFRELSRQ